MTRFLAHSSWGRWRREKEKKGPVRLLEPVLYSLSQDIIRVSQGSIGTLDNYRNKILILFFSCFSRCVCYMMVLLFGGWVVFCLCHSFQHDKKNDDEYGNRYNNRPGIAGTDQLDYGHVTKIANV